MLKPILRSPANMFALLALLTVLLLAGGALWTAHIPDASIRVRPAADGKVVVESQGKAIGHFDGRQAGIFRDATRTPRLHTPLIAMVMDWDPRGSPEENRHFLAMRDELTRLVREPGAYLQLPDGRTLPAYVIQGSLGRMTTGAWLSFGTGLIAMLAGLWVFVLRPREWAAQMFLLSGIGLMIATITIAISEQMSIATSVTVQYWDGRINHLSAYIFGGALVALFARYPFPILPKRALVGMGLALSAFWVIVLFDPWNDSFSKGVVVVLGLGITIVLLALLQGWKSRHDPALRAAFTLVGASLLLCIGIFSFVNLIPQMRGESDMLSVPVATTIFLLFYLALAVAIVRYRLFDLGGWAINMALAALVLIFVLVIDFILVVLTDATWTISVAFLTAAIAWLPIRELLLRRTDMKRYRQDILLLRGANEVAFAIRTDQQQALWKALLESRFAPLTIESCACTETEILDDGRVLTIPSPLGGHGLRLRFAGQGGRLFKSEDRSIAMALVTLVSEMVTARASYDRGVQSERQRIARDLHDDVGARLMTTLHRDDLNTVHADVREAMADMRLIIDGMSGQSRRLADIMADLRHETVNRLTLAHIHTLWPVDDLFDEECMISPHHNRVLFSVVRELVSNIIRHSGAGEVAINGTLKDAVLTLNLRDDGLGFDTENGANLGNGLRNTRKRLEECGGGMVVRSNSAGSDIAIILPLISREHGMAPSPLLP